jgi:hypothetical protein
MARLTDRYAAQSAGVVSCYARRVIMDTRPGVCYAQGRAAYLRRHGIRLFDSARVAAPLREEMRQNAEPVAREHGLAIAFVRAAHALRKEGRIRAILAERGVPPGRVHFCAAGAPWPDTATGKTTLRYKDGKCLHYYVYLSDEEVGLCYRRGPTGAPVAFLRHHRTVEQRAGTSAPKLAPLPTTIDSRGSLRAANRRYLAAPTASVRQVEHRALFGALARGEWQISGGRTASLRRAGPPYSRPQLARAWPQHDGRAHLPIRPDPRGAAGRPGRLLREFVVIPSLAGVRPAAA